MSHETNSRTKIANTAASNTSHPRRALFTRQQHPLAPRLINSSSANQIRNTRLPVAKTCCSNFVSRSGSGSLSGVAAAAARAKVWPTSASACSAESTAPSPAARAQQQRHDSLAPRRTTAAQIERAPASNEQRPMFVPLFFFSEFFEFSAFSIMMSHAARWSLDSQMLLLPAVSKVCGCRASARRGADRVACSSSASSSSSSLGSESELQVIFLFLGQYDTVLGREISESMLSRWVTLSPAALTSAAMLTDRLTSEGLLSLACTAASTMHRRASISAWAASLSCRIRSKISAKHGSPAFPPATSRSTPSGAAETLFSDAAAAWPPEVAM
mmetsp:Transcript_59298/g.150169  ORF Transcript_59298/g.150169 Transcript_59298/m.150169 type:complete len:329 (-) Transcript_59298:690-1676(-)